MKDIDWEEIKQQLNNYTDATNDENNSFEQIIIDIEHPNSEYNRYSRIKRLWFYYNLFKSMEYQTDGIKRLYGIMGEMLIEDYRHVADVMQEDLRELDLCFSAKAYKASLILAGSILEAFLIDWLSEKDGKDYFHEPFYVEIEDEKGRLKSEKKDSLYWYIKKIEEIEQPDWMEPENKADYIREKRNSVHVKLCLKKDIEINQEICQKVIQYLTDIVNIRFKKREEELRLRDNSFLFVMDL